MAAARTRRAPDPDRELRKFILAYPTEFLTCRAYKHRWVDPLSDQAEVEWAPPERGEKQGHWVMHLACERCGSTKLHAVAPVTGYVELELSSYAYAEGYLVPPGADFNLASRKALGLMRLELVERKNARKLAKRRKDASGTSNLVPFKPAGA